MRTLCLLVLAVLLTAGLMLGVPASTISRAAPPLVLTQAEWLAYAARFITPDGRVIDTGNGNISHSEGQGYAMLLAVALGDRDRFDRLWQWTRTQLQVRDDRLFAWKWEPATGRATDRNSASDGDILIGWALLRAGRQWNDTTYRTAALEIMQDVRTRLVTEGPSGPLLLPGPDGFQRAGAVIVNPSYWVFPALAEIAEADGAPIWKDLAASGRRLLERARFGDRRLPPDWLEIGDDGTLRLPVDFQPLFGFNAIRVPLYLVWSGVGPSSALLDPILSFWAGFDGQAVIPATIDLKTGAPAAYGLSSGGRAISVLARFTGSDPASVAALLPSIGPRDDYYSATLILLTKVAFKERLSR